MACLDFEERHMPFLSLWHKNKQHGVGCRRPSPFFEIPTGICGIQPVLKWIFHPTHLPSRQAVLAVVAQVPGSKSQVPVPWGPCQCEFSWFMTAVSLLQSTFLISGICWHPLVFTKIQEGILISNLQWDWNASPLLNKNFWSLDNTESHAGNCRKGGCIEVSHLTVMVALAYVHLGFLYPEECSKSLLSAYALPWSGRVDLFVHFILDPLRLSSHSALVFIFCWLSCINFL